MMPALQYLRHGKALCGKVFRRFVETFNFHNDFIANLKGDGDLPVSDGCLTLDRTDPTHPVIRLNKQKLALPEQGNGGGFTGFFEPSVTEDDGAKTVEFLLPYYRVGTKIYTCTGVMTMSAAEGFYALHIGLSGADPSATVEHYDTLGEMVAAGASPGVSVCPLYEFGENGTPIRDLRNIPISPVQEY